MARGQRIDIGNLAYHVINRSNGRVPIFRTESEYRDFEYLLSEIKEDYGIRILAYVVMPNHWHLLLYPRKDGDLSKSLQWLAASHAQRFHTRTGTVGEGHLYQGRYKSFVIQDDVHLLTVLKYIERNPVRANLSDSAEGWCWGSAYRRVYGTAKERELLAGSPVELPKDYRCWINVPEPAEDLKSIRDIVNKRISYGGPSIDVFRGKLHNIF